MNTESTTTLPVSAAASRAERGEAGRAVREQVPRSSFGEWSPPASRRDPVDILGEQDADRVPELVPIRYGRMAQSPWTFLRGAAAVMAADLGPRAHTPLFVQLSGDAHLANFGLFSAPDRRLLFDLNDFDETHPGPFEWDLTRLAVSIVVASIENGARASEAAVAVRQAVAAYRRVMAGLADAPRMDVWYFRVEFEDVIAGLRNKSMRRAAKSARAQSKRRTQLRSFAKLTEERDGRRRIVADPPLIVPIPDDVADTETELIRSLLIEYRASLPATSRHVLDGFRTVDVARKVVGVGSVGTRALMVLMVDGDGHPLLLQVKEAGTSVLADHVGGTPAGPAGRRVVEGQQLIQGSSDIFLGYTTVEREGRSVDFYVRQLRDGKASIAIEQLDARGIGTYGALCGAVLARAHARSGDASAIAGYLGASDRADRALAEFALAYAAQNRADHEALVQAIADGQIESRSDL
jgi:uncharacterized protein (DUF2252 family)